MKHYKKYRRKKTPLTLGDLLNLLLAHTGFNPRQCGSCWKSCCPAHDDQHASLSVTETPEGKKLIYCHAGCSCKEICESLNLKVSDLLPMPNQQKRYRGK